MPRSTKKQRAVVSPEPDVFDEQIAARQAEKDAVAQQEQKYPTSTVPPTDSGADDHTAITKRHTDGVERKRYVPPVDPFGFENIRSNENRVRLLKSEGEKAWVIRFARSPNTMEGYSKENPHPVIKMLKEEGYRWGFDGGDGKGGWGKPWTNDPYGLEHMEARKVLQKAAEMIGAKLEQGQGVSA